MHTHTHVVKQRPHFKAAVKVEEDNVLEVVETTEVRFHGRLLGVARRVVTRVNFTAPLFDSLLGKNHTNMHRMVTGMGVMAVGVFIAKFFGHSPILWIAGIGDMIGYAIHGLGLTPFAVFLSEKFEKVGE